MSATIGKPVCARPFHVEFYVLPAHAAGVRQAVGKRHHELPDEGHDLEEVAVLTAAHLAQFLQNGRPDRFRPQRRPLERFPVDEAQQAVIRPGDVEEVEGDRERFGDVLQFDQGERPGAVQVVDTGEIDGKPPGLQAPRDRLQIGHEGLQIVQRKAAREADRRLFPRFPFDADPVSCCFHLFHRSGLWRASAVEIHPQEFLLGETDPVPEVCRVKGKHQEPQRLPLAHKGDDHNVEC